MTRPEPTPEELAAIIAAVELAWPRPVTVVAGAAARSRSVALLWPLVGPARDGSTRASLAVSAHLTGHFSRSHYAKPVARGFVVGMDPDDLPLHDLLGVGDDAAPGPDPLRAIVARAGRRRRRVAAGGAVVALVVGGALGYGLSNHSSSPAETSTASSPAVSGSGSGGSLAAGAANSGTGDSGLATPALAIPAPAIPAPPAGRAVLCRLRPTAS